VQESLFGIAEVPRNLEHPLLVGIRGAPGEVYPLRRQFHDKEQVAGNEPVPRPNLDHGEVHRGQHIPVGVEEGLPGRLAPPIRRRLYAVGLEDVGDRGVRYAVPQIREGPLNPII